MCLLHDQTLSNQAGCLHFKNKCDPNSMEQFRHTEDHSRKKKSILYNHYKKKRTNWIDGNIFSLDEQIQVSCCHGFNCIVVGFASTLIQSVSPLKLSSKL